ncbi:MAG TPA: hypothetical protein VMU06_07590 [Stellaceae bacterium]|nr:hypothetical protein [Stellaceae bacterium]
MDQLLVAVTSYKKAKRAKDKEESSKSAVRVQGKLPPSVVRLLIWKIIELCARYRQPPPKNLPELLRVLDDTDGAGGKQAEGYRGFNRVVREYAKDPDAKPSVIAARAKVTRAAVSQWSRYPGFWEFVVTSKAKKDESKVPEDERILGVDLVEDPLFMDLEDIE